jgi:radical SAM superfamily enzyme YgiQ (UPF0313 family)
MDRRSIKPLPRPCSDALRIALVSPKGPLYRHRGGIFGRTLRYKPLTLTTLAALIPAELNASVTLYDEGIQDVPLDLDVDLVGLTVITGTATRAYELADHYRRRGITVVLGGPHVTLVPDDAAPHADAIVTGYAEKTWPQLLRDVAAGRLQPRYSQNADLDLANLPFARRELLPRSKYITDAVFEAQRGCFHDCEFCVVPAAWGRQVYQKPVGDVVADIRRHGGKRIIFVDLNLYADRAYAAELFTALIPLKVQWHGLVTTMFGLDAPMLELAARSGCRGVLMGLESIRTDSLDDCGKGFNAPGEYRRIIDQLHAHGIALNACFVFGADHDTTDVFMQTATFAIEAGIDLPRYAIATPFPGTALYRRLDREGRILTRHWELYDAQHVVFEPARMTVGELQRGTEQAWKGTYRFPAIRKRLARSPMWAPLAWAANLTYRRYARNLHRFYTCDWLIPAYNFPPAIPSTQPVATSTT